ncbi:MAG: phosphatidate cytidylyltransferase [Actinomycetota bacterium]|jgi:phosphatidate cytidylyltransferase|nr:phosphatidate cytidylyltransferase [Actinomycetota bacterium]MDA3013992.1 phosphatidate cytidylyltransferase [Actinomycetota bacterium]MDA3028086.1 phosphatidate cytidylyltransferase [Actinomycetota bacterium]
MSDDMWGGSGSLFGDPDDGRRKRDEPTGEAPALSFDDSSGPLPHWTEPPTGEIPRPEDPTTGAEPVRAIHDDDELLLLDDDASPPRTEDELWATFTAEQPVWQPTDAPEPTRETSMVPSADAVTGESPTQRPSRIVIGTDPSGIDRPDPSGARRRPSGRTPQRGVARSGARPARPRPGPGAPPSAGRDLPIATAVGLLLVAVFVAALTYRPWAVVALVAIILGLAAVEFYDKVTEKGYRPAVVPGIVTCVTAPLAAYWLGDGTLPLVILFGFIATAGTYIGSRSVDIGPLPNVSITTLPMVWIGLAGAYAALILRFSTTGEVLRADTGTDTLFMLALAVVANDVGALFVGVAAGRTPLRPWISPGKTVEGFIGGALMTIVVLIVVGIGGWNSTWDGTGDLLLLAIVVSIFAPMGDLIESMFKRNLGVKDFGSLVKGHGGVLDRFDGFLLTLPIVYYLALIVEPWAG